MYSQCHRCPKKATASDSLTRDSTSQSLIFCTKAQHLLQGATISVSFSVRPAVEGIMCSVEQYWKYTVWTQHVIVVQHTNNMAKTHFGAVNWPAALNCSTADR